MKLVIDLMDQDSIKGAISLLNGLANPVKSQRGSGILELEMSVRTSNSLQAGDILTVEELTKKTGVELLKLPNFGKKCLREVEAALFQKGLRLGTNNQP